VRFWIWLAASLKFLAPFSVLVAMGDSLRHALATSAMQPAVTVAVAQVVTPFIDLEGYAGHAATVTGDRSSILLIVLMVAWALGFFAVSVAWWWKWRRVRAMVRGAQGEANDFVRDGERRVSVVTASALLEPGILGIWRPVLMLPEGIRERLTVAQMEAVVAHEMCHVRRRDNLTAAIHMFVEAVFWFHPAVWWIGRQMVEERERACDEEVLRLGGDPDSYAEGILQVCKIYTESPVACVSGISGADLKGRIVRIMTQNLVERLTFRAKAMLGAAAASAITLPLIVGMIGAARAGAQDAQAPLPTFEVASIKVDNSGTPNHLFQLPDPSHFRTINMPAKDLVQYAYGVKDFQISGGPNWIESIGYDIEAKVDDAEAAKMKGMSRNQMSDEIRLMLRSLLAGRFKLNVTHSTKESPEYALVVAKGGPKLTPTTWVAPDPNAPKPDTPPKNGPHLLIRPGQVSAVNQPVSGLADVLAFMPEFGGKLIVDQTGIKGNYDYTVHFSSEEMNQKMAAAGVPLPPTDDSAPSIFTALEEQLGLRVEPTHGPVDTYTIEHIEQPSEN
jgi:bla regulator protein BlaR1